MHWWESSFTTSFIFFLNVKFSSNFGRPFDERYVKKHYLKPLDFWRVATISSDGRAIPLTGFYRRGNSINRGSSVRRLTDEPGVGNLTAKFFFVFMWKKIVQRIKNERLVILPMKRGWNTDERPSYFHTNVIIQWMDRDSMVFVGYRKHNNILV